MSMHFPISGTSSANTKHWQTAYAFPPTCTFILLRSFSLPLLCMYRLHAPILIVWEPLQYLQCLQLVQLMAGMLPVFSLHHTIHTVCLCISCWEKDHIGKVKFLKALSGTVGNHFYQLLPRKYCEPKFVFAFSEINSHFLKIRTASTSLVNNDAVVIHIKKKKKTRKRYA